MPGSVIVPSGVRPIERDAMTHASDTNDDGDVSALSRDELIAHNLRVVQAHFHNENPADIDKAIALYGPGAVWEAPVRGQVYTDLAQVKDGYLAVFRTVHFNRVTVL